MGLIHVLSISNGITFFDHWSIFTEPTFCVTPYPPGVWGHMLIQYTTKKY